MKNILLFVVVLCFTSCKDMHDVYEEFIVLNGKTYPQKTESLQIFPGYNRMKLSWLKPKDPSANRVEIYWNNYSDTLAVDLASLSFEDTIFVEIDDLIEGTYTFYLKTFDKYENESVVSEITGISYGDEYINTLTDRKINFALRDENNNGSIEWDNKTNDLVYSEVRYMSIGDSVMNVKTYPEEDYTQYRNIKRGEYFEYRSVFLPKNGIDTIFGEWQTSDKPFVYQYPRNEWTAEARSGNHDWGDGGGGQPYLVLDGDYNTGWHSSVGSPLPQCVVVDMKERLSVDHLLIYPPSQTNWRYIEDVQIYLSDDPIIPDEPDLSWGSPVGETAYSGGDHLKIDLNSDSKGQYLAIVFLNSKAEPNTYISFMELEVYGF